MIHVSFILYKEIVIVILEKYDYSDTL